MRSLPFATVASIMRVAHKYEVAHGGVCIVDAVATRLESFLVPSRGHWLDPAKAWEDGWDMGQRQWGISMDVADALEATHVARLVDKPRMLPLALYLCLLSDVMALRNGVPREDGTPERLSDEDFIRCVTARSVLARECHAVVARAMGGAPSASCCTRRHCRETLVEMLVAHSRDGALCKLEDLFIRMDLRTPPPAAFTAYAPGLCSACRDGVLSRSETECRAILKRLPKYFTLDVTGEPWE